MVCFLQHLDSLQKTVSFFLVESKTSAVGQGSQAIKEPGTLQKAVEFHGSQCPGLFQPTVADPCDGRGRNRFFRVAK